MVDFRNTVTVTILTPDGVDDDGKPVGEITEYVIPKVLRITGNITKTSLGYPNQGILEFFNLDTSTRAKLTNRNARLKITGGKPDNEVLFFEGDIRNAIPTRQGLDVILTVYVGSNQKDWNNATKSVSYAGEVTYKKILTDLAKALPNASGEPSFDKAPNFLKKNPKIRDVVIQGSVRDSLHRYIKVGTSADKSDDLVYTIQDDGEVVFADASGLVANESEVMIDRVGQIIGVPTVEVAYLLLKTHFLPSANVFNTLTVASEFATSQIGNLFFLDQEEVALQVAGQKRIREVVHTFDTRGGDWTTSVKASVN